MIDAPRHPAKFTDALLPVLAETLAGYETVLDPFGGTGKLAGIKQHGFRGAVYINEIETEWGMQAKANGADAVTFADARKLPYRDGSFDAVATSPVYGNKMSEHCEWKPGRKCHTYKSYLGKALHEANAGRYYFWEREYGDIHWPAWMEAWRVIKPGGLMALNSSNFIRLGNVERVTDWHVGVLTTIGFRVVRQHRIETPRQRHGTNGDKRVAFEDVTILEKPGRLIRVGRAS